MKGHEVARLLRVLRAIWRDEPIGEDTILAWEWAFADVPYDVGEDAVKRWLRAGKPWFPKPAQLLEIAGQHIVAADIIPEAAWTEVLKQVSRVGYQRVGTFYDGEHHPPEQPVFSDPLIKSAVDAIGWKTICHSEKPEVVRAQFVKTLDVLIQRAVRDYQYGNLAIALSRREINGIDDTIDVIESGVES